jgi:hypothetical protein
MVLSAAMALAALVVLLLLILFAAPLAALFFIVRCTARTRPAGRTLEAEFEVLERLREPVSPKEQPWCA